jgi:peptidoglycan/xylan/chitin deacetylase (PgdA/CDA1 family)
MFEDVVNTMPRRKPPILAYHSLRGGNGRRRKGADLTISEEQFGWQMAMLHEMGYEGVPVERFLEEGQTAGSMKRCVGLTFDDGYRSVYERALPIMERYGHRATVFAVSGLVGRSAGWEGMEQDEVEPLLSWEHLRSFVDRGFCVGSHTHTHADLTALAPSEVAIEVQRSKGELECNLQVPVVAIAYPYGRTNELIARTVCEAEYAAGFSLQYGTGDRFQLRRWLVQASETHGSFLRKLSLWRDWYTNTCQRSELCRGWRKTRRLVSDALPRVRPR